MAAAAEISRRLRASYDLYNQPVPDGDPVGELVGTILSQNTSDINSSRAYDDLRRAFPSWEQVRSAPEDALAAAIRSGGLANIKARRIKQCLDAIVTRYGALDLSALEHADVSDARAALRSLPGVGPKTAACVLLFSLGRPAIPVDTHVHRVSGRLGLIGPKISADAAHLVLEDLVAAEDAYAFHVGLVQHGRRVCRAPRPLCSICFLTDLCEYYTCHASTLAHSEAPTRP